METATIARQRRQALDFALDALDLPHVKDEAHRTVRLLELEQQVPALIADNLRLRVAQLERVLQPDEAELEALQRQVDGRLAGEPTRRLNDI